jgi:hypothetical protein
MLTAAAVGRLVRRKRACARGLQALLGKIAFETGLL